MIRDHFPEAPDDLGGAAENKRIDDPGIGCQFPEDKKAEKDEDPRSTDDVDKMCIRDSLCIPCARIRIRSRNRRNP